MLHKTDMRRAAAFLLACLLLLCSLPLSAADAAPAGADAAEALYALGLVGGYGKNADGSVNFALGDKLKRAQAFVLVVRFTGAEKDATANVQKHPFTDVPAWANPYIGYVYANGITKGVSETKFDPDTEVSEAAFLTIMLRVLGYDDGAGDFKWDDPYTLAKTVGLCDAKLNTLNRGGAFDICYRALTATPKRGDKLCDRLVQSGAVDAAKMAAALAGADGGLRIGTHPLTQAKIVVAADASGTEKLAAASILTAVQTAYGTTLPVVTDAEAATDCEIIVGKTARPLSRAARATRGAAMVVAGGCVALDAASGTLLRRLGDLFCANYIAGRKTAQLTEADTQMGDLLSNPIYDKTSAGDPCITYDGETGYYYAVYSSPKNDRVTLYRAKKLADLSTAEGKDVYVAGDDREIKHKLYAPEIARVDGKWYIYASGATSTEDKGPSPSKSIRLFCLEATGDDPFGDYVFKGFLNDTIFAIDAHVFSRNGENYVAFARILNGNVITVARLENPWTIDTKRVSAISSATYGFETKSGKINEGPHTFEHDGKLYLLYSANNVTSNDYCLGMLVLTGEDVLSKASWTKLDHAVFTGTASVISPGHCSVFKSPDGSETWLAYHVRNTATKRRDLYVGRITFGADGMPDFGTPTAPGEDFFAPRGE